MLESTRGHSGQADASPGLVASQGQSAPTGLPCWGLYAAQAQGSYGRECFTTWMESRRIPFKCEPSFRPLVKSEPFQTLQDVTNNNTRACKSLFRTDSGTNWGHKWQHLPQESNIRAHKLVKTAINAFTSQAVGLGQCIGRWLNEHICCLLYTSPSPRDS